MAYEFLIWPWYVPCPLPPAHPSTHRAQGTLLKPLPHGHLRASFVGAHMELDDRALAGALPLAPGKRWAGIMCVRGCACMLLASSSRRLLCPLVCGCSTMS